MDRFSSSLFCSVSWTTPWETSLGKGWAQSCSQPRDQWLCHKVLRAQVEVLEQERCKKGQIHVFHLVHLGGKETTSTEPKRSSADRMIMGVEGVYLERKLHLPQVVQTPRQQTDLTWCSLTSLLCCLHLLRLPFAAKILPYCWFIKDLILLNSRCELFQTVIYFCKKWNMIWWPTILGCTYSQWRRWFFSRFIKLLIIPAKENDPVTAAQ